MEQDSWSLNRRARAITDAEASIIIISSPLLTQFFLEKMVFIAPIPNRLAKVAASAIQIGMKEFRLIKLLEAIRRGVEEVGARRVVDDPLTMFTLQYPDEVERIYAMRNLIREMKKTGCTNLLISELRGTGMERKHKFEEYLSQGVIILRTYQRDMLIMVFQVSKMRGLAIDNQPRPYQITDKGLEVFPKAIIYR